MSLIIKFYFLFIFICFNHSFLKGIEASSVKHRDPRFHVTLYFSTEKRGEIYYDPFTVKKSKMVEFLPSSSNQQDFFTKVSMVDSKKHQQEEVQDNKHSSVDSSAPDDITFNFTANIDDSIVGNKMFIPLCKLVHGYENVRLHLDEHFHVHHVDYVISSDSVSSRTATKDHTSSNDVSACIEAIKKRKIWDSSPKITLHKLNYPERPKLLFMPELDAQGNIPEKDQRSFIQKYWMYIVPTLLILMLNGGVDEPQQQGSSGKK